MRLTTRIVLKRLLFSLTILLIVRIGTLLPVPGINHNDILFYIQRHSVTGNLLSTFSANGVFVVGVFSLNIFPYINATIIIQLLTAFSPELAELQKDGDLVGRRTINRLTRQIALVLAVIQSAGISIYLKQILFNWNPLLALGIILWLTSGSMIVLWLSEIITERGLGNGASLLIYTNIVSNLPNLVTKTILANTENSVIFSGFGILALSSISIYSIIFLQEGIKKVPLVSAKQLSQPLLRQTAKDFLYLPLRFNQAGVLPIILTTGLLVIPNYLISSGLIPALSFLNSFKFLYWIGYFTSVVMSGLFYSAIVLKPNDLADQLQKSAVAVPGIRPGSQTAFYLKRVIKRLTSIGSTLLAIITVIPNFIESTLNISGLNGLSTTSFLILGGVILDLIREINNIYYSNVYSERY